MANLIRQDSEFLASIKKDIAEQVGPTEWHLEENVTLNRGSFEEAGQTPSCFILKEIEEKIPAEKNEQPESHATGAGQWTVQAGENFPAGAEWKLTRQDTDTTLKQKELSEQFHKDLAKKKGGA